VQFFSSLVVSGFVVGVIYGLVAVGFVLIYKCSGIFNFAQGELLLLGSYVAWSFLGPLGLPIWITLGVSLALAIAFGLLVERLALRPLIGESILALIMVTLALSQIISGGVVAFWGPRPLDFVEVFPKGNFDLGWMLVSYEHIYAMVIAIVLLIALSLFFRYHRFGLAMRGTAEGHQVVQSMGVSPKTIIGITWAIAAMVATLGGILLASINGFSMALKDIGMKAIPAAFVGGLDSIPGAVIGGLMIGILEALASGYIGHASGTPVAFAILVLVMLFKPYGLFGLQRIERV